MTLSHGLCVCLHMQAQPGRVRSEFGQNVQMELDFDERQTPEFYAIHRPAEQCGRIEIRESDEMRLV